MSDENNVETSDIGVVHMDDAKEGGPTLLDGIFAIARAIEHPANVEERKLRTVTLPMDPAGGPPLRERPVPPNVAGPPPYLRQDQSQEVHVEDADS